VAYVGGSGYSGPAVRRTLNGGAPWVPLAPMACRRRWCTRWSRRPTAALFAGTETGRYRLDPGSSTWVDITANEAPVTIWWSAEYVASANCARFGTYGRGIWDYSLDEPCATRRTARGSAAPT
jgi:hypothetical protein